MLSWLEAGAGAGEAGLGAVLVERRTTGLSTSPRVRRGFRMRVRSLRGCEVERMDICGEMRERAGAASARGVWEPWAMGARPPGPAT